MELLHFILNPLNQLIIMVLSGVFLFYLKHIRACFFTLWICGIWFIIVVISPIPVWLVEPMEREYSIFEALRTDTTRQVNILVLAAGYTEDFELQVQNQLSEVTLNRLIEGVRVYSQAKGPKKFITSGMSASKIRSQAEATAITALNLGISSLDTAWLPKTYNTESEAKEYVDRFGKDHQLILVTSALHMKRALFWFQSEGICPMPAPTDYLVKGNPNSIKIIIKPSIRKIEMMDKWIHESIGFVWAKIITS